MNILKEALYYEKLASKKTRCLLCPHKCIITPNNVGFCLVRKNIDGMLVALNYERLSAIAVDPIEKKPLYTFMPGTKILSIGSLGCNMSCEFCQNCDISREFSDIEGFNRVTKEQVVEMALREGVPSIAYTYNEPTVFYEMVLETAKLAQSEGLKNVLVTNGYIEKAPFLELAPYVDAMNIDIKTYNEKKYMKVCHGQLEPVIQTIVLAKSLNIHVEITCLLVPDLYDDLEEINLFFSDLYDKIGDTYIHLSRYFPRYHYNLKATDIKTMMDIKTMANKCFSQVSLGNI